MHNTYENIVQGVLLSNSPELTESFLSKSKFIQKLIEASQASQHLGYMGHIAKFGNLILKYFSVKQIIEYVDIEDWKSFFNDFLLPQNEKDARMLGGRLRTESIHCEEMAYGINEPESSPEVFAAAAPEEPFEDSETKEFNSNVYWKLEVNLDELEDID